MKPRFPVSLVFLVLIAFCSTAAPKDGGQKTAATTAPDAAYLQKIWDGWCTLDPANVAQYYASGPHIFFDIAPLKYSSWDEYQKNVTNVLADYKSATCSVNEPELHPAGSYVWGTAIVKAVMTHKDGKVDTNNFRWTMVFEKQGGKWLIVHEHVSAPLG